jgi:pimeloyl-ACP methyl ester carboxylesterase
LLGVGCSLALLSSCVLTRAAQNNATMEQIATLRGAVQRNGAQGVPAFVVILTEAPQGWRIYSSRMAMQSSPFEFHAPPGVYRLFVFEDLDGDRTWSRGEPSAATLPRTLAAGEISTEPALIPTASGPEGPIKISVDLSSTSDELVRIHRGDLASLEDERFSARAGAIGYWQPADFALKYGMGISFLEPFDPHKIPVLCIRGASGSPSDFRTLIAALDRSKFQPWVFSDPSGIRLDMAAAKLVHLLDDLQPLRGFARLLVVGHSMGGLVARAAVGKISARPNQNYAGLLVTIATPFAGHEAAGQGVARSPVVLPAWRDLAPDSLFLRSLHTPLPKATQHHLFFTYVGGSSAGSPTDGTVTLRSMLAREHQESAAHVVGFAEDHDSVLESTEVIEVLNASLRRGAEVSGPQSLVRRLEAPPSGAGASP